MTTPELKSPVVVEGSTDGVTFSTITALAFAQVDFLYSAADHPIVFTTRYADLSTYTHLRITYDGTVYTIDRYLPVLRTWTIFVSLTSSAIYSPILEFADGFARDGNTITADTAAGVAGGQTIIGGTAANDDLIIEGTGHPTKTTSAVIIQPGGGNAGVGVGLPLGKFHVAGDVSALPTTGVYGQLEVSGSSSVSPTMRLAMGVLGSYAFIQSVQNGSAFRALALNPQGGNVAIGATTGTAKLTIIASTGYNQFNMATSYTPTSSADANGSNGDVAYDNSYIYIKSGGSWRRSALSTF